MKLKNIIVLGMPVIALTAMVGCSGKGGGSAAPAGQPAAANGPVAPTATENPMQAAIRAIEKGDDAKLAEVVSANPAVLNASTGSENDPTLLEVSYANGQSPAQLAALIDRGVSRENAEKLLKKITDGKVNDEAAKEVLVGKILLKYITEELASKKQMREAGIRLKMTDAGEVVDVLSDEGDMDAYLRMGDALGRNVTKANAEAMYSAGVALMATLEKRNAISRTHLEFVKSFDAFLKTYQEDAQSDDLIQGHVLMTEALTLLIPARVKWIGRIAQTNAKVRLIADRL